MYKFLAMVFIPKSRNNPTYVEEVSNKKSYWAAYLDVQKQIKNRFASKTKSNGVNVIVKRHNNES